jgi:CRISPR-associated protein Csx14
MTEATIPVDLRNPGQVFACMGLMEAAEILCGDAHAGFGWSSGSPEFTLQVKGQNQPVAVALEFVEQATITELAPDAWAEAAFNRRAKAQLFLNEFPAAKGENMSLPVVLAGACGSRFPIGHWADGSSRDNFKLYAGNRSAFKVMGDMQALIRRLLSAHRSNIIADPFSATCPMGGSFNFDPRGAWNAIDAGYSPDRLGHTVAACPFVELFAAIGLENSRPVRHSTLEYSYRVWGGLLPAPLARAALASPLPGVVGRSFTLPLFRPNPNSRAVSYAQED